MPNNTNYFTIDELVNVITSAMQNNNNNTTQNSTVNGEIIQREGFAINSKYYGETLASGEIFNPYLNRRFISSQYLRMFKQYSGNMAKAIRKNYDYNFMIKHFKSEVNKLALLGKIDKIAFNERSSFLMLAEAKQIFVEYAEDLKEALATCKDRGKHVTIGAEVFGRVGDLTFKKGIYKEVIVNHKIKKELEKSEEYVEILNRIKHFKTDVKKANSYQQLANTLNGFNFVKLPKTTKITNVMADRFMAAGAFYTLKNLINFEDIKLHTTDFNGTNAVDSMAMLQNNKRLRGYMLNAILKKTIRDGGYEI